MLPVEAKDHYNIDASCHDLVPRTPALRDVAFPDPFDDELRDLSAWTNPLNESKVLGHAGCGKLSQIKWEVVSITLVHDLES